MQWIQVPRRVFRPHNLLLITVVITFLAWLLPDFGVLRKGFAIRIPVVSNGFLTWALIMGTLVTLLLLLFHVVPKRGRNVDARLCRSIVSDPLYALSIGLAGTGVLVVLARLLSAAGPAELLQFITLGQANQIKELLYEDYSLGLVSLRYCVVLSGSFLVSRRLSGIKHTAYDVTSLALLAIVVLISSRLALAATVVGGLYLYVLAHGALRLKLWKALAAVAMMFLLLAALNWSRNANFYSGLGQGFLVAGVSEIVTYLGAPVQGALSYFDYDIGPFVAGIARDAYSIEEALTTNSALLEILRRFDNPFVGLFYVAAIMSAGVYAVRIFEKYKEGQYAFFNIGLIYSFAEFWRIFLFDKGVVLTLLAGSAILIVVDRYRLSITGTAERPSSSGKSRRRRTRRGPAPARLGSRPEPYPPGARRSPVDGTSAGRSAVSSRGLVVEPSRPSRYRSTDRRPVTDKS